MNKLLVFFIVGFLKMSSQELILINLSVNFQGEIIGCPGSDFNLVNKLVYDEYDVNPFIHTKDTLKVAQFFKNIERLKKTAVLILIKKEKYSNNYISGMSASSNVYVSFIMSCEKEFNLYSYTNDFSETPILSVNCCGEISLNCLDSSNKLKESSEKCGKTVTEIKFNKYKINNIVKSNHFKESLRE